MDTTHHHVCVAIVGGGQAGLATSYYLARAGLDHVVLDRNPRIGDSWRERWPSLRLFTPARIDGLPGMPFPGPAAAHPGKEEMASLLETYARRFDLPVRSGVTVKEVECDPEGISLRADNWRPLC